MCSRNTVSKGSHVSFFCGGDPFCEEVRRPENTCDLFAWVTHWSLLSLEGLADLSPSLERPADLYYSQKLQTLYCLFKSHMDKWISSLPTYFSIYGWLSELTYFCFFFLIICWSYLRMEISVTLSIDNKLYSRHHILYFSFLWKPLCWCYLATAFNQLSSCTTLCC